MNNVEQKIVQNYPDFSWYRCVIALTATSLPKHKGAHPLSVFEAIIKGITEFSHVSPVLIASFSWERRCAKNMRITFQRPVNLTVDLYSCSADEAEQWLAVALSYFDQGQPGKNFNIACVSPIQKINGLSFCELSSVSIGTELCLDFHTPFPFQISKGKPRYWIDCQGFKKALLARIKKLFAVHVKLPELNFDVLPYFWSYQQIRHTSHSQSGHTKYLNGCEGRLYIKAEAAILSEWLFWFRLAEQIGIGGKVSFGLGRFYLLDKSPAYFDPILTNPNALQSTLHDVIERYDDAVQDLAMSPSGVDQPALAHEWVKLIQLGWKPLPYQAFSIKKPTGGYRVVERAPFRELAIQQHLLSMLGGILDKSFEEESIGFRKGLSRQVAIDRLSAAIDDGFDYVVESDIADFFPSVQIDFLLRLLDHLLPENDILLRKTLAAILRAEREFNGGLETRSQGLATGSPLSPLLANVYLDAFDEQIKARGVRLIRFADDFIILTRGLESAEAMLGLAGDYLQEIGLQLNLEKTAIRKISEGFVFLGIKFAEGRALFPDVKALNNTLKKPVYIVEPFVFLGVSAKCLEVHKHAELINSIPLNRVSEILVLTPCNWSSNLVTQCTEHKIPIVLTTGNGRHVSTLTGGNAEQYKVAALQYSKFNDMGDAQILAIAKEFAAGKVHNYCCFIKQHYKPGVNVLLNDLKKTIERMWDAPNLDSLRGLEGIAARKGFDQVGRWIKSDDFQWHGRKRRPPDPINSLLNFSYHLLFCRISVLLHAEGLNPFLGFLHEPTQRYEVLTCDIQELFRPNIDRMVLRLINLSMITGNDFVQNEKGSWLTHDGKACVLSEFTREMERASSTKEGVVLRDSLFLQVKMIKDFFVKDQNIVFFKW